MPNRSIKGLVYGNIPLHGTLIIMVFLSILGLIFDLLGTCGAFRCEVCTLQRCALLRRSTDGQLLCTEGAFNLLSTCRVLQTSERPM